MGIAKTVTKKAAKNIARHYREYRDNKTKCLGCGETKRMGGANACSTRCSQWAAADWPSITPPAS